MSSLNKRKLTEASTLDRPLETMDRAWEDCAGDLTGLSREWAWQSDEDHRLVFVSGRVREIMQVEPGAWLGKSLADLATGHTDTSVLRQLLADQGAMRPFRNLALAVETPSEIRQLRIGGIPVIDHGGRFAGYRGIASDITEIIEPAKKTGHDYQQLFEAIQHISVGFTLYDREGRLVVCNNFYRRLYPQIAHLFVPGSRFADHESEIIRVGLVTEAEGRIEEWLAERTQRRDSVRNRFVRKLADGRSILVHEFRIPAGDTVGIHQDITVSKQREEALRQSERLFAMAFQYSPGMTAIAEIEDGTLIDVNEKWLKVYGWPREAVIGRSVLDLGIWVQPEDRARFVARLVEKGRVRDQEAQHRKCGGGLLDVIVSGELIELDGKKRMLIVGHDITDRKRAEIEMRNSQARLAGILRISPEAIIVVDSQYRITLFNEGAERIFGYSADEIIGADLDVLIPEERRAVHRQHLERFGALPQTSRTMAERSEVVGRDREGRRFPCEASISKLELNGEQLFTVLLHDITARKQSEAALVAAKEEAELANRAKSEFLANMSHELRTPLNAILGFSQVIRSEEFGPVGNPKYLEYSEDIHTSGEHLLEIINDILDLAKLDAGHEMLDEAVVDLNAVVKATLRLIRERAERGGIRLDLVAAPGDCLVRADERKVKQILINLLSNAIKFTPRDGLVTVILESAQDGGAIVTVRDTGIGMDPDQIPRILEPFTQIEGPLTRRYEGTGLGLPLVKRYCELHGGALSIQSSLGQGTSVRVRFPRERTVSLGSGSTERTSIAG